MLLLVALPTFGWRFVSDRYTYWEPWYQYDAVLVPIAVAAMIEGAILPRGSGAPGGPDGAPSSAPSPWSQSRLRAGLENRTSGTRRRAPPRSTACSTASRTGPRGRLGRPRRSHRVRTDLYLVGDTIGPADRRCRPLTSTTPSGSRSTPGSYVGAGAPWKGRRRGCWTAASSRVVAEGDGVVVARRVAPRPASSVPRMDEPSCRACVVYDESLTNYDFGPTHPMNPVRVDLTMDLAGSLGVLDRRPRWRLRRRPTRTCCTVHDPALIEACGSADPSCATPGTGSAPTTTRPSPTCTRRRGTSSAPASRPPARCGPARSSTPPTSPVGCTTRCPTGRAASASTTTSRWRSGGC